MSSVPMSELARKVFHNGFVPQFSTKGLIALRDALVKRDPFLMAGVSVDPPPLQMFENEPVVGCCPIAFAASDGEAAQRTVGEVETAFALTYWRAGEALNEPTIGRHFANYWDDTPIEQARRELLVEVEVALAGRKSLTSSAAA